MKPPGWEMVSALLSASACRRSPSAAVDIAAPRLRGVDERVCSLLAMIDLRSGEPIPYERMPAGATCTGLESPSAISYRRSLQYLCLASIPLNLQVMRDPSPDGD